MHKDKPRSGRLAAVHFGEIANGFDSAPETVRLQHGRLHENSEDCQLPHRVEDRYK